MRHILRINIKSFTLVETMVATAILSIIMAGFLLAITSGGKAKSLSTAQIEVQSEVRRVIDWIAKDVRQARRVDIGKSSNNPTSLHIKFNMVVGYNTSGLGSVQLSDKDLEYTYNPGAKTITRTETTPGTPPAVTTWTFNYIIEPPFYTRIQNEEGGYDIVPIDPLTMGGNSPVYQSGNLVLRIIGQKQVQNGLISEYALIEEVRVRN